MLIEAEPIKPFTIDEMLSMFDHTTGIEIQPKTVQPRRSRRPIVLALAKFILPEDVKAQLELQCRIRLEYVGSVRELFNYVTEHANNIHTIIIGAWDEVFVEARLSIIEVINAVRTVIQCSGLDIKIAVGINSEVDHHTIQEIRRMPINYIWPGGPEFSVEAKIETMKAIIAGEPFIHPKLDTLLKPPRRAKTKSEDVQLTPRQNQIMEIIAQRGSSNKVIARMLGISESTVKLHMSGILKKFGVRNRTQLALFVRDKAQV